MSTRAVRPAGSVGPPAAWISTALTRLPKQGRRSGGGPPARAPPRRLVRSPSRLDLDRLHQFHEVRPEVAWVRDHGHFIRYAHVPEHLRYVDVLRCELRREIG